MGCCWCGADTLSDGESDGDAGGGSFCEELMLGVASGAKVLLKGFSGTSDCCKNG